MDRITVAVGDPASTLDARLGKPDEAKTLNTADPATMGAAVVEYTFRDPVVTLTAPGTTRSVRAVQFVVDGGGRILRILENPNPYGPAGTRLQRGTPFLAERASLPTDPALRVATR